MDLFLFLWKLGGCFVVLDSNMCAGRSSTHRQPERRRLYHHRDGPLPLAVEISKVCGEQSLAPASFKGPFRQQQGPVNTAVLDSFLFS